MFFLASENKSLSISFTVYSGVNNIAALCSLLLFCYLLNKLIGEYMSLQNKKTEYNFIPKNYVKKLYFFISLSVICLFCNFISILYMWIVYNPSNLSLFLFILGILILSIFSVIILYFLIWFMFVFIFTLVIDVNNMKNNEYTNDQKLILLIVVIENLYKTNNLTFISYTISLILCVFLCLDFINSNLSIIIAISLNVILIIWKIMLNKNFDQKIKNAKELLVA